MPVLSLPDDLIEQLENSTSETINSSQGPGVAHYASVDGRVRADIYAGLILDAFRLYENISAYDPTIAMQFSLQPDVYCKSDDINYDPRTDKLIVIKVNIKRKC